MLAQTSASFNPADFSSHNLEKLKSTLEAELVAEGLFPDEAQALLNTWELSYFKSPGLRVFFLVPRTWTDFLSATGNLAAGRHHRVMVGRIELITPAQRSRLQQLASYPVDEIRASLPVERQVLWPARPRRPELEPTGFRK